MTKETLKILKETKEGGNVKMNKILKDKNGITLIALVVTIVVLLILAGVTISLIVDNNGIIQRTKDAKREYGKSKTNEQKQLEDASDWIDEAVTGKKSTVVKSFKEKKDENSTINGGEGNSNNPTIPAGYVPINTDTSKWGDGSTTPSQDSVDRGLVIKDDDNNEWVWVPVDTETLATMYEISSDAETLSGTTGETAVTTNKYSKSEIISGKTRTVPGTNGYREPDLIVYYDGTKYDAEEIYYKTILGFESKEEMAEAFVTDYNEMIASISQYGGFYIGRYELSGVGVQKDQPTLTNKNWYNLYEKCKELKASNKVETRMIWGCQWDVTMNWLINSGAKTSYEVNANSSSWGNYYDASVKADDGITELKASGTEAKLNTGVTTYTMANNIYDLAGNCNEWTQEASSYRYRAERGGNYSGYYGCYGSHSAASSRGYGCNGIQVDGYGLRYSSNFNNKIVMILEFE